MRKNVCKTGQVTPTRELNVGLSEGFTIHLVKLK